jgi:PERQ amino acid-rich with GYF domain-containing protein
VNSPLKPPPQNANKDQNTPGSVTNGRKTSVSHGSGGVGNFGMASPTTARPGARRRETSDTATYQSLASPGLGGRFNRDEPSPYFSRKNDFSGSEDRAEEPFSSNGMNKTASPFGTLMRSNTAGSGLGHGTVSPWGPAPASATMAPMGNFGSFAMPGNQAQPPTPSEKRPGFGSVRGESRLFALMPKESSEDISGKAAAQENSRPWRSRPRNDTDPFDDQIQSGSASLMGGQDDGVSMPQQQRAPGHDTPTRQISTEFGMSEFHDALQNRDHFQQGQDPSQEPGSPIDTNPYAGTSSERRDDVDDGSVEDDHAHHTRHPLGGIPEHGPNHFGGMPRGFTSGAFDGSDRSQTSSVGGVKGFPTLGGLSGLGNLGGLGGWPTSANPIGTPDRERPPFQGAFGSSIFTPMGDMQSQNLGSIGGGFGGSSSNLAGTGTIGRNSKLTSLFPAAMQAQMQGADNDHAGDMEHRQGSAFGAIGKNPFGGPPRDTDSPMRGGRGVFDEMIQASENRNHGGFPGAEASQGLAPQAFSQGSVPNYQQSQGSSDSASSLPQTQQRTMVMPDRMRWVYLDPSGNTQGPWSGLEMHDWYKANFFTADLSVKKVEDAEFEPLGQLIRRIGNSREPFLVPQIGVPHGPATTQPGAPFAPAAATSGAAAAQAGSVQPPFAGAFPSFGTTLTAEQQNNLERRKQEEQYLMARQREFLAQQQVNLKQLQMQGGLPSALHHHSSAHSLQSQPSFGSITSPIGMPPQGPMPIGSSFFDGSRQPIAPTSLNLGPEFFREDELSRLSLQDRQQLMGGQSQAQQLPPMFPQQPEAHRDGNRIDQLRQSDPQAFNNNPRLREFEQLRAQHDLEQQNLQHTSSEPVHPAQQSSHQARQDSEELPIPQAEEEPAAKAPEVLTLTEQVQKAASAKHTPAVQPESPWGKVGAGLPMPFPPPPQSTTPLPAPLAQRGRSDLAEALNMGTRSRSETPEVVTPSIAPWAKEPTEAAKGPSLKEIQEAEAKKAAKIEEVALAARRAAAEQELRSQPTAPAPGLPTTSTWGKSGSPAPPANAPSPWAKATAVKAQTPTAPSAGNKKTLADIQREEELRKQKLAAAVAATALPGQASGGKRYADLASKTSALPSAGSAWSTVGAGGKVKIPTGPASSVPAPAVRAVSAASISPAAATKPVRPAVTAARTVATGSSLTGATSVNVANQEFLKWAKNALVKDLKPGVDGKSMIPFKSTALTNIKTVDDFVNSLMSFPAEADLIAESVYSLSQTIDSRRYAEEFIRRRKVAEKGIVENASSASANFSTAGDNKSSGGWNEVAKKGPAVAKEEPTAGFKVVPNKKKGRK